MKQLNTLPIEDFLEKTRIAIKTNQKATDLQNSLAVVMTRIAGELDELATATQDPITINMDGGKF